MCDGWTEYRIDELGNGQRPVLKAGPFGSSVTKATYEASGYKVYGQQEVVAKDLNAEAYFVSEAMFRRHKSCAVEPGDILMTMMGTIGRVYRVPQGAPKGIINPRLVRIALDKSRILPEFAEAALEQPPLQRLLDRRSHGGTMQGLNLDSLASIQLLVPSLPEQRKIATILRTWDEALEKLSALRAAKDQRLVGLRAALLFGELRLNGQRRNWAPTRLGTVTHELTKRNGTKGLGRDFVMGVTKAEGVVPMREQTIAGDISRYKRLPPRAFAYNPMRINVGSIAMNEREEEVLVSPDYVVFACNADGLDPDYLDHLRKTSWWAHYINSGGSGSVRQRTYYDDLAALKLPLPELDEQKAIAAVLNTARADLAATEREIEAVTLQKRGLMQKLLTGEWRVPLDPSEPSAATEETEHAG